MEEGEPKNVIVADDGDFCSKLLRSKKAIAVLYASNCQHSKYAMDALSAAATIREDILFVAVEVKDIKSGEIKAPKIHDYAGITHYPIFVAFEGFVMKDKEISKRVSEEEQSNALGQFISKNFPKLA